MIDAGPPQPPRRPYWLLIVVGALLVVAPAWAAVALIAAGVGLGVAGVRRSATERAARASRDPSPDGLTLLGTDARGRTVRVSDEQLGAHGLIVGASGAGKSTTLLTLLTDHAGRGRPVIAIDMKGSPEFAHRLGEAAAASGRRLIVWTLDGPSYWNPLGHGNPTELKDKLIATERFTEPHYQRAAERYAQTALRVLQDVNPDRPATLADVVQAMDPRRLAVLLRGLDPQRAEPVAEYLDTLTPDQLSAVRGLATRLAIISESHTGRFLGPPPAGPAETVDLRRALAGEQVVLFSLNSSVYGKLAAQVGSLAIQDLTAAVGHRLGLIEGVPQVERPAQALIGLDEFSGLASDNVLSLMARGRAAGVSVMLSTQEMADLDRAAPGLRDQVIGNTAIKIAHRQDVPASAVSIAQMVGTVRRWEESYQFGGRFLPTRDTGRGTRRQVEQFRVHPNAIKTLGPGEAVVLVKAPTAAVRTI